MTVSCWFKLSVPSTVTLTKNMVILANARRSDPSGAFSFLIQFNINTGNIEFTASGTSPLPAQKLIERPYLDRWCYIAVTRSGGDFTGYVDGRTSFNVSNSIGSSDRRDHRPRCLHRDTATPDDLELFLSHLHGCRKWLA